MMGLGRRRAQKGLEVEPLQVKPLPSYFRCPISMEVMKSPVSLCTGVTYDRASIQRWLDSGHRTCPATRIPLPSSVDLVPNLTLRRLIHLWSDNSSPSYSLLPPAPSTTCLDDLLRDLRSSDDPIPHLRSLEAFFSSADSDKNHLVAAADFAPALASLIVKEGSGLEVLEAAFKLLALILETDSVEECNKQILIAALVAEINESVSSIIRVLKMDSVGSEGSRVDASKLLDSILSSCDADRRIPIVESSPDLFPELVRLIRTSDDSDTALAFPEAIDVVLRCLVKAAQGRRARAIMVRAGAVPALVKVLAAAELPAETAERALLALKVAASCAEGRVAICQASDECVNAIMGRMVKVGKEGREAAVSVLWAACVAAGDRKAREAVVTARGGAAKILVVMQGECSPAVAGMAGELLKVFRVDAKSCFAGYDTKSHHITPF